MKNATPAQAAHAAHYQAVVNGHIRQRPVPYDELDPLAENAWDDIARSAIAAQDARPVRADEFARVKVKLCALVDSLDKTVEHGVHAEEFDQGAAHASAVTARQLRAILDETALDAAPEPQDARPAPELATADMLGVAVQALRQIAEGGAGCDPQTVAGSALGIIDRGLPGELRWDLVPVSEPEPKAAPEPAAEPKPEVGELTIAICEIPGHAPHAARITVDYGLQVTSFCLPPEHAAFLGDALASEKLSGERAHRKAVVKRAADYLELLDEGTRMIIDGNGPGAERARELRERAGLPS